MITFKEYVLLKEAIPLYIAKSIYTRKNFSQNYTEKLNKIFNGKDRIILPFDNTRIAINMVNGRSDTPYGEIRNYFNSRDFSPLPWFEWIKTKGYQSDNEIPKEKKDELEKEFYDIFWEGYYSFSPQDYIEGLAYRQMRNEKGEVLIGKQDRRQKFKIGKLLQKSGREDLLKKFKEDPARQTREEYVIVISRHPYDIAGKSTDRNWTSCLDYGFDPIVYKDKKNKEGKYIKTSKIKNSDMDSFECYEGDGMVAYLVPKKELMKNGKIALRRPISRVTILNYDGEYVVDGSVFGVQSEEFENSVEEWVKQNLPTGDMYEDSSDDEFE